MTRKRTRQQAKKRRRAEQRYIRGGEFENKTQPKEADTPKITKDTSGFIPRKLVGRSENQVNYIRVAMENDITLAHGPAGSGKTHIAVGLAVKALKEKKIERIVLSRPAVDSGASIGYLPGGLEEKMAEYLAPLFDELSYYIDPKFIKAYMEHKIIQIVPLTFMRGRTFNNAFVVLDEAQNATPAELKMALTRIGQNSHMVLVGDLHQSDLPKLAQGGFSRCIDRLADIDGVGVCKLSAGDIVRHHLIAQIEKRLADKEAS